MRKPDWATVISEQLAKHEKTKFVWGQSDCCLVVADIVKSYTDHDMAAQFRGKYKTELGAYRAIKKYIGTLEKGLDAQYMRTMLPARGDIALVETEGGESLAVIFSSRAWAMSLDGLKDLPMSSVKTAWEVV